MKKIVEICCGSYEDCLVAFHAKADRIELNAALYLGGLTPSLGTLRMVKKHVDIPVVTMVRNRGAGFCYDEDSYMVMREDAKLLLENGSDGIVFGFLDEDGNIQTQRVKEFVSLAKQYHKEAIFHRAFDCVPSPYQAIEQLIALGVDRVLTSGQKEKAYDGRNLIKQLQERYGDRIQILPGSGIHSGNARKIIEETGVTQVHSSCKVWCIDPTTHLVPEVDYSYGQESQYERVSELLVEQLVRALK